MTPLEISEYKRNWMPGNSVSVHSDIDWKCKAWCRKNLDRREWSMTSWTQVYEHTFHFENAESADKFKELFSSKAIVEKTMKDKYVVVTAVSTHRMRYVVPLDELQKLNPDVPVNPEWAMDCVTCEEVEEFSQKHIGEQIVDCNVLNEDEILELFDKDNDYLAGWDREQKINHIRNWRETWSKHDQ